MFQAACMLYVYVETPLHAGSGRGLGGVDLPIQRERVTGYPLVQASSLKGKLRAEAYLGSTYVQKRDNYQSQIEAELRKEGEIQDEKRLKQEAAKRARVRAAQELGLEAVFGPETDRADAHAGALSPNDARLLLFPVRSLAGVFAWTTSGGALARFLRDARAAGLSPNWQAPTVMAKDGALVAPNTDLKAGQKAVLEEFTFSPTEDTAVTTIGQWLTKNALPTGVEYQYWRDHLPRRLIVLHEDAFRDFTLFGTEVVTRIKIDNETKTVAEGMLWTEESLPADTLLYAPLYATLPRADHNHPIIGGAAGVLNAVRGYNLTRVQLGGDETVGRGLVHLRFGEVKDV
jgi:CRISPR-associated protein Cmr4